VLVLIAGTLYHWLDGLHHFTEHMRHRRRVHELEADVASLRARLDQVLEMPEATPSRLPERKAEVPSLPEADDRLTDFDPMEPEPLPEEPTVPPAPDISNGAKKSRGSRKRVSLEKETIENGTVVEPQEALEQEA